MTEMISSMKSYESCFALDRGQDARAIHLIEESAFESWKQGLSPRHLSAVETARFAAKPGSHVILPGADADEWQVALGVKGEPDVWRLAALPQKLPPGCYRVNGTDPDEDALGWALGHYSFDRYKSDARELEQRVLLLGEEHVLKRAAAEAEAQSLVRDLVNTPAEDMGPAELEDAARHLAAEFGAEVKVLRGDDLLSQNFPTIHAVGRAASSDREPRLVEINWGRDGDPRLAVVGKGVCFDSGGLDVKSAAGMRLMKKDMGGAAHALALARLVMKGGLRVRLQVLVPAVENSVSASSLRPGDVVKTRKGLTVEVHNTDAEGRLILCDALSFANESKPDLLLDFATLTGAARVALGPDLPAVFTRRDQLAADLAAAGAHCSDPVWRLPLWEDYQQMLSSEIADLSNAANGSFAGAVTAALYLSRFVDDVVEWAHFDTFAWMPSAKPGRPKGGEALGLRAAHRLLLKRYSNSSLEH